jgi:hypothetical protein
MLRRERFSGQRPRLAARLVVARVHGLSLVGCGCGLSSRKTRAPVGLAWLRLSWGVAGGDAAKARRKDASTSEALSHSPECAASPARQLPSPTIALALQTHSGLLDTTLARSIAASTNVGAAASSLPMRGVCDGVPLSCGRAWTCLLSACLFTPGPVRSLMPVRPTFNQSAVD